MTASMITSGTTQPALPSWRRRLLVSLSVIVFVTLAAGGTGFLAQRLDAPGSVNAVAPQPAPAHSTTSRMPLVVDPGWLNAQPTTSESPLILIDLSDADVYDAGHIPGAIHAWWQDGMDRNAATYGQVLSPNPDPTGPREWFRSLGIDASARVVVYDNQHGLDASRFVWLMAFVGLEQGAVLNGGLASWKGAGLPVSNESAKPTANTNLHNEIILHMLIGTPELASRLEDPALTIIDIRTPDTRAETLNDTIRPGSIPSSMSIPWTELVIDGSGQVRPTAELQAMFARAGLEPGDDIVVYGQFGKDTGLVWLALRLTGYEKIRVYDEGWARWASQADLPIAP